jgi:uncharacterized protein YndB with AHSA1/START domain
MEKGKYLAEAETIIQAPAEKVWDALVDPEKIKKYMFGTNVQTDWKVGSKITWTGEWEGKSYEDKGEIVKFDPPHELEYTHYSSMAGGDDSPENYHTVNIRLEDHGNHTHLNLSQDNNATEEARNNSEKNWNMMLDDMKKMLEG